MQHKELHKRPPRFELKYIVPLSEAKPLMQELTPYCLKDEFSASNRSYEVSSLYYDTQNLKFHLEREESVGYRRKVRLRAYVDSDSSSIDPNSEISKSKGLFIEIKEKHKQRVVKKRVRVNQEELIPLYPNHSRIPISEVLKNSQDHLTSREVNYLNSLLDLKPIVLIRYIRETLVGRFDNGLRITLDSRVSAGGSSLFTYEKETEKLILPANFGIFEIKSFGTIPLWLQQSMQKYPIQRTKFSKYCEGVIKCGMSPLSSIRLNNGKRPKGITETTRLMAS